jgi:2'-5' RNA ligase
MPQGWTLVKSEPVTPTPPPTPASGWSLVSAEPYTAPSAPAVRPSLADPVRPAVSHVRVDPRPKEQGLATIGEQLLTKTLSKATGLSAAPTAPNPHARVADQAVKAAQDIGVGMLRYPDAFWGALRGVSERLGLESVAAYARAQSGEVAKVAGAIAPDRTGAGQLERGVSSGLQSIGANAPALLTGNPVAALGMMGFTTAGNAYNEAREKGLSPDQAAVFAATDAVVEVATEKIPMSRLFGDLARNAGLLSIIKRQLVSEGFGEQAATLLQDANRWAHLNPEKTAKDFAAERPDAAVQTLIATIVGTLGQSAGAAAVSSLTRETPQAPPSPQPAPVEAIPPTLPSAMPAAENWTLVKAEPVTAPSAPVLPAEFHPVDAPLAAPVTAQPAVNPDAPLDVMTNPVEAAQTMRAENPQIDQQAREMAEKARAAKAVFPDPMAEVEDEDTDTPPIVPIGEKPEGVSHKFSSTQLNLPPDVAKKIDALAATIPQEDLSEHGREDEPHVTVKYGITTTDPADLAAVLKNQPPITITLGKTSHFPNVEDGTADAVKVDIEGPELRALNKRIAAAVDASGDTHPDYKPHATVAYVKPGLGKKYDGDTSLKGQQVTIDRLVFSGKDGQKYEIPLTGKPSTVPAPVAERMKAKTVKGKQTGELVTPKKKQPSGPPALERRADYNGDVDASPRVKNKELDRKHAFLMQWLADDMRQMPFEESSRMRGKHALDVTSDATSQEEAREAVYKPRVAGTPTQETFAKMGVSGSRAELASQIENYLSGRSKGGKAVDAAKKLAPIFEAAYNVQTKRFDFTQVPDDLYAKAGITYEDMRAPVTGPANPDHELAKAFYAPPARRRAERSAEFFKKASERRATLRDEKALSFDPDELESQPLTGVDLPSHDPDAATDSDPALPGSIEASRQERPAGEDPGQSPAAVDVNEFGEGQSRLPGAESVRRIGQADTSLKAPVQASGDDFSLFGEETPEAKAAREKAEAPPSLFDEPSERQQTAPSGNASVGSVGTATDNPVKPGTLPKGFTSVEQPGLLPVEEQALTFDATRPIEFPELVDLARELSQTPQVVKAFRGDGKLGVFESMEGLGTGTIRLHGDLFKRTADFTIDTPNGARVFDTKTKEWSTLEAKAPAILLKREDGSTYSPESAKTLRVDVSAENLRQLAATLAHEIGHLVDWLPSKTLKRGNILGRLRSLRKFLKETYTAADGSTIKQKEIRAELQALSDAWRPWDKTRASASFRAYRQSSKELYADALSVLLNSPGLLQEKAPKFYEQFFAELDRKPDVRDAYFSLQELLSGTREELVERRRAGVRGMFEGADAKAIDIEKLRQAEAREARKHLWLRIRIQHVDKNTPVIDRVKALEKRGVRIPVDQDPRYFLEERNYIGGKQKAFVEKHFQPVYQALTDAGIDWHTFGEALLYERIIAGDRSELANPRGLTVEATKELYATLQGELNAEQMQVLVASVGQFRAAVKKIAEDAFKAGLYKPELYDQMKENPAYAAFRVVDYLEKDVTSKVHHQIGTLKDIQNPADATILKTLVTLRATEYQLMKVATFKFLHQHFPEDIQQAKQVWNGKGIVPVEPEDPKKQTLVYYYEQGKLRGKYVDPYIADSLNNESVGGNWAVVQGLRWINSHWFRPVFTSLNLGFQTFNLGRDFLRFWKNTPQMTFHRAMLRYYQALPMAKARAFGLPDHPSARLQQAYTDMVEAEEARILSTTFNDLIDKREIGETQIEDIFAKTGVTLLESPPKNPTARALVSVLNWIKRSGDFIETLPKAAGIYEYQGTGHIKDIPADKRSFIRRKIGSPDFLSGGTYKPVSNELLLFSNAITQAIRADLEVARDPQTRAGFWWKTAALNVAPKLALFAAIYGFADDDDDWLQALRGITEYDLTNYLPIPLGTDDKGQTIYVRLPQDDFGRLIGGLVWKALQGLRGDKDAMTSAMQVFDYTAGQVPGVTPILSLMKDAATLAAGGNVYDDFRNRFLFTDDELAAKDGRTLTKFLAYEFQQLGGGLFWKFSAGGAVPRDTSATQQVLELPIVSNILGRWIRVTNFGELERLRAAQTDVGKHEARRRLAEREAVQDAIREYQRLIPPQRTPTQQQRLARDVVQKLYADLPASERAKEYRDVLKKIRMGAARGSADPYVDALMGARSTDQRVAVMLQAAESMGDAAFQSWLARVKREQLVSDTVVSATQKALRQRTMTR